MGRLWAAQELLRSLGQLGGALEICRSTGGLCELWSSWGALQLLRNSEVFGAPGELWSFGAAAELAGLFSWWLRHHLCLPKASGTRTHPKQVRPRAPSSATIDTADREKTRVKKKTKNPAEFCSFKNLVGTLKKN